MSNELYSGRKKRWWDDKRFSGSKKNDDQVIRSHEKSASVGMKGFHAGGDKGVWRNNNAEYHPEKDDRPTTRDGNRTASEGEKALQMPYDDPMGTPKSWSNPSDATPDDETDIRRLGRRSVEEGEIERYKPKKGEGEQD